MKNHKSSLIGCVLGFVMLFAGVQSAFASCMGTAYFLAPSSWEQAVFSGQGVTSPAIVTTKNADGYFEVDLSTLGMGEWTSKFGISNSTTAGITSYIVMDTAWLVNNPYDANAVQNMASFTCPTSATGKIYIAEDIFNPGKTFISNTEPGWKYFYVLLPEEKEWQSDDLMISYTDSHGAKKQVSMIPAPEYCGWLYAVFDEPPVDAVLYLKNYPETQLGINGLWDDDGFADPIDLSTVFDAYGVSRLYFIPDETLWPEETSQGWYTSYPDVDGTCTFTLAAIIYDSDHTLNEAFTDEGTVTGTAQCVGVFTGLVKEDLGPDGKPQFSGTDDAIMCFGSKENFDHLFNYTPGVNEMQCYDMPFRHYGNDTRWGFDSDSTHYDIDGNMVAKGGCNADSSKCVFSGGFYPLEQSSNATVVVIDGVSMGPTPAARTKRHADAPVPLYDSIKVFDHYCNTKGWFDGIDCGATHEFHEGSAPPVWNWGVREDWKKMNGDQNVLRNQEYCFQSHATFTYNESQEFTFRGDDDIWVFINNKIAVDNGGAHLAAPGHVVLKNLNTTYTPGCSGNNCFLVPGQDYPIDIFFCDRRLTMTNVIIKTNMYIKQSTGLDFSSVQNSAGGFQLDICVEKTGGGDCAAVALGTAGNTSQETKRECGGDISTSVNYSITTRKGETPANCSDCAALLPGGVVHGGIDLTNPKVPVVYPNEISGLPPGSYRLIIEVDGKKTHYNFRIKGNLGIVHNDVTFDNVDDEASAYMSGTKWTFVDKAMAGTRIPIYISAPDDQGGIDLISAPGQSYTLTLTERATLYKTNDPADVTPISTPYLGQVNPTGIDTFWVEVPLAGLATATQEVTASVGNTSAKLTFYSPTIKFAEPATKDSLGNPLTWNPVTQDPNVDENGDEYFHWVSSDVDLYVVAMNPITGGLCTECTFDLDILESSPRVLGTVSKFHEGVALVRIRSEIEYSTEAASIVVASVANNSIAASYGNMHFYKPPTPMPMIVDLFDVKGVPGGEMNIPAEYLSDGGVYLDGKADSMAVIYDRAFDKDSIPTYLCLNFDDEHLKKINPFEMGISNNSRDTEMFCSTQFDSTTIRKAYNNSPDNGRTLVFAIDSSFTKDVKTLVKPDNKIASFTIYKWKGKEARTFFEKGLTDRIAPVILSARASTETDGGVYDLVKIVVSEPVSVVDASVASQAFSYYLNSAIDIASESARYLQVTAQGVPQPKKDTLSIRYYNADPNNPTPHVGDYIRFRADKLVWADTSNGAAPGMDTLRQATDADMHWNSPTDFSASVATTGRLPSPWVQVVGDAKIDVTTISFNYADPTKVTPETPVGEVFPVKTNENLDKVKEDHPGTLGHFVQSDMGSIIGSDDKFASINHGDIYFFYQVDYYSNLGTYVASQSGKIYCNDKFFSADPKTTPDGMGDCVKNPRNFYVAWNMLSDKHRLVGTGAYITKYTSYVKLGDVGKKAKKEKTEVWGVKRGKGLVK